jgi:hypothetical protein
MEKKWTRTQLVPQTKDNQQVIPRISETRLAVNTPENRKWNSMVVSLILLLQRPWFTRTWIIQEAVLATTAIVLCGNHSTSWEDLVRVVDYVTDHGLLINTIAAEHGSIRHIERERRNIATGVHKFPLDYFVSFRMLSATDPRDKVYALYSLLAPADVSRLHRASYRKTMRAVYIQTLIDCIDIEDSLDILSFAGHAKEEAGLPSWVPDWREQDRRPVAMLRRFATTDRTSLEALWVTSWQSATGESRPVYELSGDRKCITLLGTLIDEINVVGDVLQEDHHEPGNKSSAAALTTVFATWESICGLENKLTAIGRENAWDLFWKTIYAGHFPHGSAKQTGAAFKEWYDALLLTRDHTLPHVNAPDKPLGTLAISFIMARVGAQVLYKMVKEIRAPKNWKPEVPQTMAVNRRMFRTSKHGYVGLTSAHVQKGDHVALFSGGKVPFILRKAKEGRWRLISDAYARDLMDGMSFDSSLCEMIKLI